MQPKKTKADLQRELSLAQARIAQLETRAARQPEPECWRFALEGAGDGVWDWNCQTNRIFYSTQWKAMLGYAEDEIGDSLEEWSSRVHPDDLPAVMARMQAHLEGRTPSYRSEHRLRCKDGSYKWILDSGMVFEWANGQPLRVIGTHKDITTSKQTERRLRESEYRFRSLYESMTELSAIHEIVFDSKGDAVDYRILDCNPAFEKILGIPRDRATGALATRLYGTSEPPYFDVYLKVAQTGTPASFETKFIPLAKVFSISVFSPQKDHFVTLATDITERKQAERDLRESEERLAMVLEGSQLGYWDWNIQTGAVNRNARWAEMLGYTLQEIQETINQWTDLHHPDDREAAWKSIQDHLDGKTPAHRIEYRMRAKDGHYRWILDQAKIVERDAQGRPLRMSGTHTDITERKLAEEALKESEERFSAAFFASPVAQSIFTRDGTEVKAVNDACCALFEASREELIGTHTAQLNLWQTPAERASAVQELKSTGRLRPRETPVQLKSGQTRTVLLAIEPISWKGIPCLISSTVDITDRQRAEDALRSSQEKFRLLAEELDERVRQRTRELQDLYDNAPAGYHSLDPQGHIININQTELNWLGYRREELLGTTFPNILSPASRETFQKTYPVFRAQGVLTDLEMELLRKDGSILPVLVNATAIYDEQGNYLMSRSTLIDNTEHKKAENVLRHANIELARAIRMKDEFMANMSHELRTPLTGILGLSEALQQETYGALNEKQTRAIDRIETSGRHLLSLINDILDLSKIEAGKLEVFIDAVSASELCQASLQFIHELARKKNLAVEFISDPLVTVVQADQRRLKQILVNLLSNAVKFTPPGGKITLQVLADPDRQMVDFSVRDTGIGIQAADLGSLFHPFTQIDSSLTRQYDGTGLGLVLVKELAELHHGSVRVESQAGQGSTFTVSLPWQPAPALPQAPLSAELRQGADVSHPAPEHPGQTILLAEDSEINIMAIGEYLESRGFRMLYAANGREAIQKTRAQKPSLILMDIQMPVMDGLTAIQQLRADPRFTGLPIIALTAMAMPGDRERCIQAGANEYVVKPLRLKELAKLIRTLLPSEA